MEFGDFKLDIICDGFFKVVNEKNLDSVQKVKLGMNLLLIRGEKNILIDTGIGSKKLTLDMNRYEIDYPRQLLSTLTNFGIEVDDIDFVICTHLHFDHIGGNTVFNGDKIVPTFPNAQYILQKLEFDYLKNISAEEKYGNYFEADIDPLVAEDRVLFIDGNYTLIEGIDLILTGGHTPGHQVIKIASREKVAYFLADLIPTLWHLNNDLDDVNIEIENHHFYKKKILESAYKENALLFFQHSPRIYAGYLTGKEYGKYGLKRLKK